MAGGQSSSTSHCSVSSVLHFHIYSKIFFLSLFYNLYIELSGDDNSTVYMKLTLYNSALEVTQLPLPCTGHVIGQQK